MIRNFIPAKIKSLLDIFPLHDEISLCFAYGSAVFDQNLPNSNKSSPSKDWANKSRMIDLVMAVDDPIKWHHENMKKNWSHYSSLRYFGAKNIANIQEKFGAKIYYNTLVPIDKNSFIKYGIISTDDLLNDLLDWDTLYISGRLHKPIMILHEIENKPNDFSIHHIPNAIEMNYQSALHAALLSLPEKFSEKQLYMTIANLSYSGDFRMWFGEDRSKVEKIVWPQMKKFREIYSPLINNDRFKPLIQLENENDNQSLQIDDNFKFEQNCSSKSIEWHLNSLPKNVQFHIGKKWLAENTLKRYMRNRWQANRLVHQFDIEDLMHTVASDLEYRRYLQRSIQWIVFKSSITQTIKGFFTAGPKKSLIYSYEKILKMFKSLQLSKLKS